MLQKKMKAYDAPQKVEKLGLYPYFRIIESEQDTVVKINGKDVFMASKVKKDPDTEILKVRLTKDGTPFWTMTSEQIAMEMKKD